MGTAWGRYWENQKGACGNQKRMRAVIWALFPGWYRQRSKSSEESKRSSVGAWHRQEEKTALSLLLSFWVAGQVTIQYYRGWRKAWGRKSVLFCGQDLVKKRLPSPSHVCGKDRFRPAMSWRAKVTSTNTWTCQCSDTLENPVKFKYV